jgi:hypothetical protein
MNVICPKCGEDFTGKPIMWRHAPDKPSCLRNQLTAAERERDRVQAKYERAMACLKTIERYGNCKICGGEVTSPYHSTSCELAALLNDKDHTP